jgi:hypothetical protein
LNLAAGFDKAEIWNKVFGVGDDGQEDAPWNLSRRAFLYACGPARCLYGGAGMIFDNLICR